MNFFSFTKNTNKNLLKNKNIFAFLFLWFCLFSCNTAQVLAAGELYINQYPVNTTEDEQVSYTLKSDIYPLNTTKITWKVDGKSMDEGIGRTTFTYKTPKQNKESIITAEVTVAEGDVQTSSVRLRATPYFILYEGADSYTPAFYKGRALPSKEGITRLSVLSLDPNASVDWTVNDIQLKNNGKSLVLFKNRLTDNSLSVSVNILKNGLLQNTLEQSFAIQKPEIVVYSTTKDMGAKSELEGGERAKEFYLSLEPYYFSTLSKTSADIVYTWRLNNQNKDIKNPSFVRIYSTKQETLPVSVSVKSKQKITQTSQKSFNLILE